MTRVVSFLVRNWPLKLAAIVLSTLLYAGLVLSQNAREVRVTLPIQVRNQPADTYLVTDLPNVTRISYLTTGEAVNPSDPTFNAWIDLASVDRVGTPVVVPVMVEPIDRRITVTEVVPSTVSIQLDPVVSKDVPVRVEWGDVPPNLEIREPTVTPDEVTVSGPQSVIARVAAVRADVVIEPSALDVDREVQPIPITVLGEPLAPVDVEPRTVRVQIPVFSDLQSRSLPVNPVVTGAPAAGFEVADVSVEPAVVTVEGDAGQLADLRRIDTAPVSIAGATASVASTVALALPTDVLPLNAPSVTVTVTLREVTGTRSFTVGVRLVGARGDRTYGLSTDRVVLTLGGPVATLDRIDGGSLTARADVAALAPGTHDVRLTADLPSGVTLVAVNPAAVTITVAVPEPTPAPAEASPTASPVPSPSPA